MSINREKELLSYAEGFLKELSKRCLFHCGKGLSAFQLPVFKKFLSCRIRRELQFYKLCLNQAVVLVEAGADISEDDITEVLYESFKVDEGLKRDIIFLPIRIDYDYDKLIPPRRKRIEKHIILFKRLLSAGNGKDYDGMVRKSFSKDEFIGINDDIVELYAEEAFILNLSLKSVIPVNSEDLAHKMYCSMIDVGFKLNRESAERIFNDKIS